MRAAGLGERGWDCALPRERCPARFFLVCMRRVGAPARDAYIIRLVRTHLPRVRLYTYTVRARITSALREPGYASPRV